MAPPVAHVTPPPAPSPTPETGPRVSLARRTLRRDRWWLQPAITASVLLSFVVYSTWAAFQNSDYFAKPYLSPFYSPCIASVCNHARNVANASHNWAQPAQHLQHVPNVGIIGTWWPITPALWILIVPLGFRMTCYYYRKSYYRSIWASPPACAVGEPHKKYSGETKFPLIMQNAHRYFFYLGLILNAILTYDAVIAFQDWKGNWGHAGLGTLIMVVNAVLLWAYSLSCHSCRHIVGGRLKHFSRHPIRFKFWGVVSKLNAKHMQIAWASLVFVALTDVYIRLLASGTFHDPRFF